MGVDLEFYPQTLSSDVENPHWSLLHDRLHVGRNSDLWEYMGEKLRTDEVAATVCRYSEEGLEKTDEDGYGAPLEWAQATALVKVVTDFYMETKRLMPTSTRAAVAYLAELPPRTRVILWWH